MFRALAFVAVRQQHHQTAHAQPLDLAGGDKLINNDLCAVGEITKLGFPKNQHLGLGKTVAVFEAKHTGFRKRAVDHLIRGLAEPDIVQRREFFIVFLIGEDGMAL